MILTKTPFALKGNLFRNVFFPTRAFLLTLHDYFLIVLKIHVLQSCIYTSELEFLKGIVKHAGPCSIPDLLNQSLEVRPRHLHLKQMPRVIPKYAKICSKHHRLNPDCTMSGLQPIYSHHFF